MRQAWFVNLTGRSAGSINDPIIDPIVTAATKQLDSDAAKAWDSLRAAKPFTTSCFADVSFGKSPAVTEAFKRLNLLSRAYHARGGAYAGNAELRADILAACDWTYAHHYNEGIQWTGNWWDWEIGTPLNLNSITTLMYDFLSPSQLRNYMAAVDHFTPGTETTGGGSGANGAWGAIIVGVRAVLIKDQLKLNAARDKFSALASTVKSGEGFYPDGSYIGHTYFSYTGGYGLYFLQSIADGYFLMGPNSAAPLPAEKRAVVYGWVENSYWPLMYRGQLPYFSLGREIGRGPSANRSRAVAFAIVQLVGSDQSAHAQLLLRMAKSIFIAGGERWGTNLGGISKMKALMADRSIVPLPDADLTTIFPVMQKTVALRPAWGVGLS